MVKIDGNGHKWVVLDDGISKFDGTNWTTYTTQNSGLLGIGNFIFDGNNNLWIGSNLGLQKFDGTTWTTYKSPYLGIPSNYVYDIIEDKNNMKWICTGTGGLVTFNDTTWNSYNPDNSGIPIWSCDAITIDSNNNKWMGARGLVKFDDTNWTVYTSANSGMPHPPNIYDIDFDSQNNIWITSWYYLSKFDGDSAWTSYNKTNSGLPSDPSCLTIDKKGNKWIGTEGDPWNIGNNDIAVFNDTTWIVYNSKNSGLPLPSYYSIIWEIYIDRENNKWICTNDGLVKFDDTNWTVYTTDNSSLPSKYTRDIIQDINGNYWLGTLNGVVRFSGNKWKVYNPSNSGIPIGGIYKLYKDRNNSVWFGTQGGGLAKATFIPPIVDFTSDTVCLPNDSTHLSSLCEEVDIFTKYEWDIGNDGSVEYTTENPVHLFTAPGIYPVKLTASNLDQSASLVKNVVVGAKSEAYISADGALTFCPGNSVKLTAVDSNYSSGLPYAYLWSTGDTTKEISVSTAGKYSVKISNYTCNDRSDTLEIKIKKPYDKEEICIVTVDTSTWKNKVMWMKTRNVETASYKVYKETSKDNYDLIATIPFNNPGQYIDMASVPESHGDKYKISVVDSCGNESEKSFYHKTINLTISAFGSTMGLNWDDYIDESGNYSPSRYYIYRGTTPSNLKLYDSISGSFHSYNDVNIFTVYYYLVAVKRDNCNDTSGTNPQLLIFSNKKDNAMLLPVYKPTLQASNINFFNLTSTSVNYTFTRGNGSSCIVLLTDTETSLPPLLDDSTYTVGMQIGSTDWYCMHNGTTNFDSIQGLTVGTYKMMVCEYNGLPGQEKYLTDTAFKNPNSFIIAGIREYQNHSVKIYPNPFTETTTVKLDDSYASQGYTYTLLDCTGKALIHRTNQTASEFIIEKGELKKGIYFIEIDGIAKLRGKVMIVE